MLNVTIVIVFVAAAFSFSRIPHLGLVFYFEHPLVVVKLKQ